MKAKFVNESIEEIDEGIKSALAKGLAGTALIGGMMGTPKITRAEGGDTNTIERTVEMRSNDIFKKKDRRGNLIIGIKKAARIDEQSYAFEFYKIQKNNRSKYVAALSIISKDNVVKPHKGLTIFFEDGTKIEKPNAYIDHRVYSVSAIEYVTEIQFTEEEAKMLSQKQIKGYIFHGEETEKAIYSEEDAQELAEQVLIVMNAY